MTRKKLLIGAGALLIGALTWILVEDQDVRPTYHKDRGYIFGTYYTIQYESVNDMEDSLVAQMQEVDRTLSMFNPESQISRINRNETTEASPMLERVFQAAREVSEATWGAFDITVAPLVNAWGFGTEAELKTDEATLQAIRQHVGYNLVDIHEGVCYKFDEEVKMDLSAIAKGLACDQVAAYLEKQGVSNYLVEIGGEIVAKGTKKEGKPWCVGITKPIEDPDAIIQELQDTIYTTGLCMASSGNYRRFYYLDGEKRSHTIDPRTGYPVNHSLLSATIVSGTCMRADALATACMVLGEEEGMELINRLDDAEAYFIIGHGDETEVVCTEGFKQILQQSK